MCVSRTLGVVAPPLETKQPTNQLQVHIRNFQHIRSANGHWATLELLYAESMRNLCGIYAENKGFQVSAEAFCNSAKDKPKTGLR